MYFEQFYLGCLAHASYLLASEGEAVVVDPQRDVELYLAAAAQQGVAIRHIFETHLHADFVSGHKELAARTGAKIYIGAQAGATFPHVPVGDGFELRFGKASIRVLETPGHTAGEHLPGRHRRREVACAVGGSDRGHAVHWRCWPP